jgi:hypothetical protein
LWFGSNSLWAVHACPRQSRTASGRNTNRSAPFNPRWAPPFAAACAQRLALGGVSFQLTMEQHIDQPRLRAAVSSEHGSFTVVAFLEPVENMLMVNITALSAVVTIVSTRALNSRSSPSRAAVHGSVGTVTCQAVNTKTSLCTTTRAAAPT